MYRSEKKKKMIGFSAIKELLLHVVAMEVEVAVVYVRGAEKLLLAVFFMSFHCPVL